MWVFYVYVTWHGCYSETPVLHVGYQNANIPHSSHDTWYSEPVKNNQVYSIYEKVEHFDGNKTCDASYVEKLITDYINELNK